MYSSKRTVFVLLLLSTASCPLYAKDQIEANGDILQIIIPSVAYGTTFYLDDEPGRTEFYKSFFTNLAITHGLKSVIDEKRPNGSSKSFPSGHTSAAFQGAAFIHKRYGLQYSIPAYIAATYVGYSRVESKNHFSHDVLAGAVIGTFSSFYFTTNYKSVMVTPYTLSDHGYGVQFSYKW